VKRNVFNCLLKEARKVAVVTLVGRHVRNWSGQFKGPRPVICENDFHRYDEQVVS